MSATLDRVSPFTVEELLTELQKLPPNALVFQECDYGRHHCEGVEYDDKSNQVTLLPG